jgi:DUF1365 family protein
MSSSPLFLGQTWHHRKIPVDHQFKYPVIFIRFNIAQDQKYWGLKGLFWVQLADFVSQKNQSIQSSLQEVLTQNQIHSTIQKMTLLTLPRFLWFGFRPASFWALELEDGSLIQITEINNTYGEKHLCVLKPGQNRLKKEFFVSPFNPVEGEFEFDFEENWQQKSEFKIQVNTFNTQNEQIIHTGISLTQSSTLFAGLTKIFTRHLHDLTLTTTRIILHAAILLKKHNLYHYDQPKAHASTLQWTQPILLQRILLAPWLQKIINRKS